MNYWWFDEQTDDLKINSIEFIKIIVSLDQCSLYSWIVIYTLHFSFKVVQQPVGPCHY